MTHTQVFKGNTSDVSTFSSQIEKAKERFKCKNVTYVGDRGLIKSGQIEDLAKHGFHYITAITKKQIETLVEKNVMQYELFDEKVCEISENNIRYIFRKNPIRAKEVEINRNEKRYCIDNLIEEENQYLLQHPKAKIEKALKRVESKIKILKIEKWLSVKNEERKLNVIIDEDELKNEALLDGCYVLKTDLKKEDAKTEIIHDRYKDLALVETAFRTCKSTLEIRPIYVRSEMSTYGHVLVVMLAYMIIKKLDESWSKLYLTVEEGLRSLSTLTAQEITVNENYTFQRIPEPRDQNKKMLDALEIELPKIIAKNDVPVVTRKSRRKSVLKI